MAASQKALALILGGGQGTRLFPLTQHRSKPAVPIGGKCRLIDIPVSNCLHAGIRRIFVLTQFNSASLNRHISQTYRMDLFSPGFVEVLAAEQTPDNPHWFQGTVGSFYDANIMLTRPSAPFKFYDPRRPIYTHPRFLPGSRVSDCSVRDVLLAEGCSLDHCTVEESIIGIRTTIQPGAVVRRAVLLGADAYESDDDVEYPRLGIGRDVVLDRVIVDKNARIGDGARLVNEAGVEEADGDGFVIRNGVIVVPKDGVIPPGTTI